MNEIYRGFSACWPRGVGMMTIYFSMVDSIRRRTNLWDHKSGQFLVSGGSALFAFLCIWPLEVLKNLDQAGNKTAGNTMKERINFILKTQGVRGFYRGFVPGGQSVFLRNGSAMIVMQLA